MASPQENVQVAIRMRPLNEKEERRHETRVWRCAPSLSCVNQCTAEGKPIRNTTFTFGG